MTRKSSRRAFLKGMGALGAAAGLGCSSLGRTLRQADKHPNVLLILTDDQGYGDLGCHGNPHIKTPNLDRLYAESVRFTQCCSSPVCTPTRASLMTGRYNYRTRAIDTYRGRAMMDPEEVTIAEMLGAAGYRTGIFGKWHLGDNYPMRAMDQGFQESFVHRGGGLMQPSSPADETYFMPWLSHNGVFKQYNKYCTDLFADAAMAFIEQNRRQPFFAYLATNAPHAPLQVDDRYVQPYRAMGLDEQTAKTYGMIANLDENVGRVLAKLTELGLDEDTIVIFMTDNGSAGERYNAGLRGKKGEVYQGGIRVPCFVRWPGHFKGGQDIDRVAAHIDITPTLLELCGVTTPKEVALDGKSLVPLLTGSATAGTWPDRTLFFQWHRGDAPIPYKNCAVRTQQYKLVNGQELYDLAADPGERNDLSAQQPERVARMRADYDRWLADVSATRGYDPPSIHLGSKAEPMSTLTRQDWRGVGEGLDKDLDKKPGYWDVVFDAEGPYFFEMTFPSGPQAGVAHVALDNIDMAVQVGAGSSAAWLKAPYIGTGPCQLRAWVERNDTVTGANFLTVQRTKR